MRSRAIPSTFRPCRWSWLVLVLAVLALVDVHAAAAPGGAWRPAHAGDTPTLVLADYAAGRLQAFDPARPKRLAPGAAGIWVVIVPREAPDADGQVLSIEPPPWDAVTVYTGNLAHAQTLALDDLATAVPGHGRLAWRIPADTPAASPILVRLAPSKVLNTPLRFQLQGLDAYLHGDAGWLTFATACFAAMLTMVLMALCFAVLLRDVTYAWYSGYITCFALILAVETGYVFHPLQWSGPIGSIALVHSVAVALSVAFAALFLARFCALKHYAPLLHVPTIALAVGMAYVAIGRASGVSLLVDGARALFTPLLTLGAGLLFLAALAATLRGSRPAWLFLVGWVPLILFTAANNVHLNGALSGWAWPNHTGLALGAVEAILLSIGLADRAVTSRQDRDQVRELADHDALTNVLNRRAWTEHATAALAGNNMRPMALLFLDLDYFKALNDRLGHPAGDRALVEVAKALRAELRPRDVFGRYGGEEFVVLLDSTTAPQAVDVGNRLRRRIHRLEIPASADGSFLTVSIGMAMHKPIDSLQALVERADQAMYRAKSSGRNRVVMHQPDMLASSDRPHLIERRNPHGGGKEPV